jgi:hypothetical protein
MIAQAQARLEGEKKQFLLSLLPSFYEVIGCQAPAILPPFERAPAGADSSRVGSPRRRRQSSTPAVVTYVRRRSFLLAGPWKSGWSRPPSIRGDSRSHTSCSYALDRGARRSICKTVPAGTRRTSERRAPVWTGAPGARPYVVGLRCAPSGTTPCSTNRHRAITSLRATATMPIRRLRPPAIAKRR